MEADAPPTNEFVERAERETDLDIEIDTVEDGDGVDDDVIEDE